MTAPSNLRAFNGSYNDLEQAVKGEGHLVVVDFFASYCPPCKRLMEVLPNIATQHSDVTFLKVDITTNEDLAERMNVSSIPSIQFMKFDGSQLNVVDRVTGFDPDGIQTKIQKNK